MILADTDASGILRPAALLLSIAPQQLGKSKRPPDQQAYASICKLLIFQFKV